MVDISARPAWRSFVRSTRPVAVAGLVALSLVAAACGTRRNDADFNTGAALQQQGAQPGASAGTGDAAASGGTADAGSGPAAGGGTGTTGGGPAGPAGPAAGGAAGGGGGAGGSQPGGSQSGSGGG